MSNHTKEQQSGEWQSTVSQEWRNNNINNIFETIFPLLDSVYNDYGLINMEYDDITHAKRLEDDAFEQAQSVNEYLNLIIEKVDEIRNKKVKERMKMLTNLFHNTLQQ